MMSSGRGGKLYQALLLSRGEVRDRVGRSKRVVLEMNLAVCEGSMMDDGDSRRCCLLPVQSGWNFL